MKKKDLLNKEIEHIDIKAINSIEIIKAMKKMSFSMVCAEIMGYEVPMHKYAVQITVADVRDGACSSSTLKEANSWGKVDSSRAQMVYAEATTVVPLLASYAYHKGSWKKRKKWQLSKIFDVAETSSIII
jgi:hypothetical protein